MKRIRHIIFWLKHPSWIASWIYALAFFSFLIGVILLSIYIQIKVGG
jgi:hypothetical protein